MSALIGYAKYHYNNINVILSIIKETTDLAQFFRMSERNPDETQQRPPGTRLDDTNANISAVQALSDLRLEITSPASAESDATDMIRTADQQSPLDFKHQDEESLTFLKTLHVVQTSLLELIDESSCDDNLKLEYEQAVVEYFALLYQGIRHATEVRILCIYAQKQLALSTADNHGAIAEKISSRCSQKATSLTEYIQRQEELAAQIRAIILAFKNPPKIKEEYFNITIASITFEFKALACLCATIFTALTNKGAQAIKESVRELLKSFAEFNFKVTSEIYQIKSTLELIEITVSAGDVQALLQSTLRLADKFIAKFLSNTGVE
jgi:hypothetical protein